MRREDSKAAILVVIPFGRTNPETMVQEGALAYLIKPFNTFSFKQVRVRLLRAFPELAEHSARGC